MLNNLDNPAAMLAWLSQRNHHIPLEDLAYMLESKVLSDYPEELDLDAEDFTNMQY